MKPAEGFTRLWPSIGVAGCFLLGAVLLARAVATGDLSTTYVLGLGLEAVASVAVGLVVLRERVSAVQAVGLGLVVFGMAAIRLG
jgi:small multidrug resistance pump